MSLTLNTAPFEIAYVKNPMQFEIATDAKSVQVQVYIESFHKSASYKLVATKKILVDPLGIIDFDIKNYLEPWLEAVPPDITQAAPVEIVERIRRYYIVCTSYDADGDEVTTATFNNSGDYYRVMLGGISKEEYPTAGYFENYLPYNQKFLSWQPTTIDASFTQHLFRYFLVTEPHTYVYLDIKYYNAQGTLIDTVQQPMPAEPLKYDIWQFNLSYDYLNSLTSETDNWTKAEFYLKYVDGSNFSGLSELITINYIEEVEFEEHFLYLNSLGGYDSLLTTGLTTFGFATKSTSFVAVQSKNDRSIDGNYFEIDKEEHQSHATNTGYLTMEQVDLLRDLILSPVAVKIKGNIYLRVFFSSRVKYKEDQDLYSLTLNYTYNFKNTVYTPVHVNSLTAETFYRVYNNDNEARLINNSDKRIYFG